MAKAKPTSNVALRHDGGPAFPNVEFKYLDGTGIVYGIGYAGMTLRDYFAGQAMAAALADAENHSITNHEELAVFSYRAADAMLAARTPPAERDEE